jgi:hypothetical protein
MNIIGVTKAYKLPCKTILHAKIDYFDKKVQADDQKNYLNL